MKNFFGPQGLTSSSADHLCNVAKNLYESLETKLESTNFLEEYITIIGAQAETKVALASKEILTTAPEILKKIAELKSFIAWFREGIKEKERSFSNMIHQLKLPTCAADGGTILSG